MKIFVRIEGKWIDGLPVITRVESYEYCGPVDLCDRGTSQQVAKQGMAQSAQDQKNAQAALANTNTALSNYNKGLGRFMQFGRQTFGANGEFMRDQNTIANTTAAGATKGAEGDIALQSMRTGENTAGFASSDQEARRQSERDVTGQLAGADASRLSQLTNIEQYGVDASKFPASVQAGLYGSSTGGAASNLGASAEASKTPGFWDTFAPALVGAAGNVAKGFASKGGGGGSSS